MGPKTELTQRDERGGGRGRIQGLRKILKTKRGGKDVTENKQ